MPKETRAIFEPGEGDHLLRNWTSVDIAAAGGSHECTAAAPRFFGRMDGYSDSAGWPPEGTIEHITMRIAEPGL